MLNELFEAMRNDNRIHVDKDLNVTASLNGVKLKVNGIRMYDWARSKGYTITGKEIEFMDGNSTSYTLENEREMTIEEYLDQVDHQDINEFLNQ